MWPLVLLLLCSINLVRSTPSVSFPINAQVPPLARVGQPFQFQFAQSTFSSTSEIRGFTLKDAPAWLHLDSASRTLSGTPGTGDIKSFTITLTACDVSGSIADKATLIVTADDGLRVAVPIEDQLHSYSNLRDSSSLLYYTDQDFSVTLNPNTFGQPGTAAHYYAVSDSNTPLPAWIHFDPANLIISGHTPKLETLQAPPQSFKVNVIASNTPGFAGATVSFTLIVGAHELHFSPYEVPISASRNQSINIPPFRNTLFLDGVVAPDSAISSVQVNAPDWVHFDKTAFQLSGTAPSDASSTNVTITVNDSHHESANLTVRLTMTSSLFTGPLPSADAIIGEDFSYLIPASVLRDPATAVSVQIPGNASWLSYDSSHRTLSGRVPSDTQAGALNLRLSAGSGSASDVAVLVINIKQPSDHSSITSSSVNTATGTSATDGGTAPVQAASSDAPSSNGLSTPGKIALCILLPIFFATLMFAGIYCCLRRRRRRSADDDQSAMEKAPKITVTPATPARPVSKSRATGENIDPPKQAGRLSLLKRYSSLRTSKIPSPEMRFSGHSFFEEPQPAPVIMEQHPRIEYNISPRPAPPPPALLFEPSTDVYVDPIDDPSPSVIPINRFSGSNTASMLDRRLSGVGHGTGSTGPTGHGVARRSWRGTGISNVSWETGGGSSVVTVDTVSTDLLNEDPSTIRWVAAPEPAYINSHPSHRSARSRRASRHGMNSYRGQSPFFSSSSDRFSNSPSWKRRSRLTGPSFSKSSAAAEEGTSVLSRILETYSHSRENTQEERDGLGELSRAASQKSRLLKRNHKRKELSRMSSKTSNYSGFTGQFDSANDLDGQSEPPLPMKNSYTEDVADSERNTWWRGSDIRPARPRSALLGKDSHGDLFSDFAEESPMYENPRNAPKLPGSRGSMAGPTSPLQVRDGNAARPRSSAALDLGYGIKHGEKGLPHVGRSISTEMAFI